MNESVFNHRIDELFVAIEDALDESGVDVDFESAGGILTITCEANGSQVILSRQAALAEVWVAARSGGFHLAERDGNWVCGTTGESLPALLDRVLSEQCGEAVSLGLE